MQPGMRLHDWSVRLTPFDAHCCVVHEAPAPVHSDAAAHSCNSGQGAAWQDDASDDAPAVRQHTAPASQSEAETQVNATHSASPLQVVLVSAWPLSTNW